MMIKLSKFNWILFFALPLFFMACGSDDDSADPQSIVEIATSDDQFSTLAAALTRVNLVSTLEGAGPFTVFAPTNAAFTASGINIDNLTDAELTEVLLYHVLGAEVQSSAIAEGQTYATTATATGPGDTQLSVLIEKTAAGAVSLNGSIKVTTADVTATNGVIHIIDNVLLPLDVVGHASANSNFTSLVTSLGAATGGLVSTLQTDGPFTVFAPLNSAFEAAAGVTATLDADQLAKVLLYHVVSGNVRSSALSNGMSVTSLNDGVSFTVNIDGSVTITDAGGSTSTVVLTDVQATNGVIHVLNAVIVPDNL